MKWLLVSICLFSSHLLTKEPDPKWHFNKQLTSYFENRVQEISADADLSNLRNSFDIKSAQNTARTQLWEMLGMDPIPEKSDLNVRITGTIEHEFFTVENIVFEALPGLYVTGNLYKPKIIDQPLPAILYVCGHATVFKNGYNYGAKAHYQHHPAWYARNGYICLIIDTLQLGEIEGIHHGLYRHDRWWWLNRGYTPAGIEAWNGIRAIDYLVSRPEVDSTRIGMTGRSGGGATSWWVGALDERVKVVAPISGITDLENHVLDGCVEGHCDCMYFVNTYQWDFSKLGLLIAPRPLLIGNADQDGIFPLNGVYRTYEKIKLIYDRLNASEQIALNIVGGGHHDIQDIQIPTFRWFNHYLKNQDDLIEMAATKYMNPEDLKALPDFPKEEINTIIDQQFVARATPLSEVLVENSFPLISQERLKNLDNYVFRSWPKNAEYHLGKIQEFNSDRYNLTLFELGTQVDISLPLLFLENKKASNGNKEMHILDDQEWDQLNAFVNNEFGAHELWNTKRIDLLSDSFTDLLDNSEVLIFLPMRGAGIASYTASEREMTHIRRRYYLLGETLETAQTFDLSQGLSAISDLYPEIRKVVAKGRSATMLTFAVLRKTGFDLHLENPSITLDEGPYYLNVSKYKDASAAILMASTSNEVHLELNGSQDLEYLRSYVTSRPSFRLHF